MPLTSVSRRVPFGMGTVTMVLAALLIVAAGITLSGGGERTEGSYEFGKLRDYSAEPSPAWTLDDTTLPGYGAGTDIAVADVSGERWLISYPSGIGKAFLLVDRGNGRPLWGEPVVAGLGDCAFTDDGRLGCAIRLGDQPDGFYLVDVESGALGEPAPLDDSAQVIGVGDEFLRINQGGYQAGLRTPEGRLRWERTFAAAARATIERGLLIIESADGTRHILDQENGSDLLTCTQCQIFTYPSGIVVQYTDYEHRAITGHSAASGRIDPEPVWRAESLKVEPGPAVLPVVTAADHTGEEMFRYEVRDPVVSTALWSISDTELSVANTRPCGSLVAFALKDRSRAFYRLTDGARVGASGEPAPNTPNTTIDYLSCVGSAGDTVIFANNQQLTGFDARDGEIVWEFPLFGEVEAVDGFLVVQQGSSISRLRAAG